MKSLRVVAVVCLAMAMSGCALQFNTRSLGVPVSMAETLAVPVAGDTFNVTRKAVHMFWGLATAKEANLQQAIAGQLGAGTSVRNLSIRARKRWSDVLVSILTLGFVQTTSVTFSGVVAGPTP